MTELETQILSLVAQTFNKTAEELSLASNFKEDLVASSLSMVSLIANVEDEFDIMIPISEAAKFQTIADLVQAVETEL